MFAIPLPCVFTGVCHSKWADADESTGQDHESEATAGDQPTTVPAGSSTVNTHQQSTGMAGEVWQVG